MRSITRYVLCGLLLTFAPGATANEPPLEPSSSLPAEAPEGAIMLFDGEPGHLFVAMDGSPTDWPIEDGALVSTENGRHANHIVSKLHFRDADLHIEFMLPPEGVGNSGVYIHGGYEMQIFNSTGRDDVDQSDVGALYGFEKPLKNAGRPPEQWQAYDIRFHAPRRNEQGEITQPGSITAYLNGELVQNETKFEEPRSVYRPYLHGVTPYLKKIEQRQKETGVGPVFLQDHGSPVRFRNVWVRPLDIEMLSYEPEANAPAAPTGGEQ